MTRTATDQAGLLLHADVLLARAALARLHGEYDAAIDLADVAMASASGNSRVRVRAIDIKAGIKLDQLRGLDAVELAEQASALASRTGVSDTTRTAHATLALAYLDQGHVDDALSAARAAARFFRSKRALVGGVVLGIALVRDEALVEASSAFSEVADIAGTFRESDGRPYWVWEVLGVTEAGLWLCGDSAAQHRSLDAYRKARQLTTARGARRRCLVLLDALTGERDWLGLEAIRVAADGATVPG